MTVTLTSCQRREKNQNICLGLIYSPRRVWRLVLSGKGDPSGRESALPCIAGEGSEAKKARGMADACERVNLLNSCR